MRLVIPGGVLPCGVLLVELSVVTGNPWVVMLVRTSGRRVEVIFPSFSDPLVDVGDESVDLGVLGS